METALFGLVFLVVGIGAGYAGRRHLAGKKLGSVEEQVEKRLAEAETKSKEIVLDAKEKAAAFLADAKNEERERRKEIDVIETRLVSREELLDKRSGEISHEESSVRAREDALRAKEEGIAKKESEAEPQDRRDRGTFREGSAGTSSSPREGRSVRRTLRRRSRRSIARIVKKSRKRRLASSRPRSSGMPVRTFRISRRPCSRSATTI